jgi:hypothetical protein
VWSYDTIGYVKTQIEHEQNIPAAQQRLVFRGVPLEDQWSLAYYNIEEDDIIQMLPPQTASSAQLQQRVHELQQRVHELEERLRELGQL